MSSLSPGGPGAGVPDDLAGAAWIARAAPRSQRTIRHLDAARVDYAAPGHTLAQAFHADGPVAAVGLTLAPPPEPAYPSPVDVKYRIRLETPAGDLIAETAREGSSAIIMWERLAHMIPVNPPAPPGDYVVVLRPERGRIGWATGDAPTAPADDAVPPRPVDDAGPPKPADDAVPPKPADDAVSPVALTGQAFFDFVPVPGVRVLAVDVLPAPNPVFRRRFQLDAAPAAATLAAAVLGAGAVRVNGARVGLEALGPALTDYDRRILYRTWDVAHLLRAGGNEIVIEAGRDRYAARGGDVWGWCFAPWHREPCAVARLRVGWADGSSTSLATDGRWECAPGPVQAERFLGGEDWVLRAREPDWEPVSVVAPPAGTLHLTTAPPVTARPAVAPHRVDRADPPRTAADRGADRAEATRTVFDFSEVMTGRVRCRVSGETGGLVRVKHGEWRDPSGDVVCDNPYIACQAQVDSLRLEARADGYVWEPQFGYRGFRWIEVETRGDVLVEDVRAVPLCADLERVGELRAAEPVLEWIDATAAKTFLNGFHGIPTGEPTYEKAGWTADGHGIVEAALHHFDLEASLTEWVESHMDAQSADGSVPWIVPTPGWGAATDPGWSISAVLIPWRLYLEYGDRDILKRAAPMARRFADGIVRSLGGGLWRAHTWGDWLSPGHAEGPEGMAPIGTIMAVAALRGAAAVLRGAGQAGAARFDAAAADAARAYHDAYFDPAAGVYAAPGVGYRQGMNILPLAFGAVPAEHVGSVRAGLVRDLEERTGGHLDCGFLGVRHLPRVLSEAGRDDLAIAALTIRTSPGWGAWYEAGETTLLESWDADARSRSHYSLGSVAAWIQQRIGALRLTEPG
ncbi:MAG: family 78 glycoside hydrolase catalytic domain, partial [Bifidobacteriaceae bacterium]|nr:family 78 glycoside hydrolase catalytic domain [Bifidobacteriaceae bacterium]